MNDYAKSKDWPGVSAYLESQAIPADLVIQLAADAAFGFYYRASAPEIALPESPAQTPDAIRQRLDDALARYNSLWLVGHTFPDWPNAGVVENYLQDSAQRTRSTTVAGLSIQQYMPWDVRADEITRSSLAVFGGAVELAGVRVFLPPEPTGEITVWLYWRALDTTPSPYKVFLHLQGQINPATGTPLWTQDDRFPQNGRISTDDWALAAIYRDVYLLPVPPDLPVGEYELRIGLYDPQTGGRLPLREGSDSYRIQTVTLP